jgi:hypothetical protein
MHICYKYHPQKTRLRYVGLFFFYQRVLLSSPEQPKELTDASRCDLPKGTMLLSIMSVEDDVKHVIEKFVSDLGSLDVVSRFMSYVCIYNTTLTCASDGCECRYHQIRGHH